MAQSTPWNLYESNEEIGKAIQIGLVEKLEFPVAVAIDGDDFLIVIRLPENEAHIRFNLEDLKSLHDNVESFVSFMEECWQEGMQSAQAPDKK